MVVIQVTARAQAGQAARVEQLLRAIVGEARDCAGCVRYEWFRSPDADDEIFVYAEFDSADAFVQYRRGPVVKRIGQDLFPLLAARPSFKHFEARIMEQA